MAAQFSLLRRRHFLPLEGNRSCTLDIFRVETELTTGAAARVRYYEDVEVPASWRKPITLRLPQHDPVYIDQFIQRFSDSKISSGLKRGQTCHTGPSRSKVHRQDLQGPPNLQPPRRAPSKTDLPRKIFQSSPLRATSTFPIHQAAEALNVGETWLKQKMREHDIKRWPYRKVKSLDKLVEKVQQQMQEDAGNKTQMTELNQQLQTLLAERHRICMGQPRGAYKNDPVVRRPHRAPSTSPPRGRSQNLRALHRIVLRNMPPSEIETELPKAHVKRLVKATLHEMIGDAPGSREFSMSKDALLAFSEAGKIFVHYLTATANDLCKEGKRQTISAKDVFTALKDLEFDEFTQPLKEAVESFRKAKKGEAPKKTTPTTKPEAEDWEAEPAVDGDEEGGEDGDDAQYDGEEDEGGQGQPEDGGETDDEDDPERDSTKRQRTGDHEYDQSL
eukprot:jgi/Tetstr1/433861/TSEL_023044.t2